MIGGPPIQAPYMGMNSYPAPYSAQPQAYSAQPAWPQQAPARAPVAQQSAPPRPIFRAKGADDPAPIALSRPAMLAMPSPSQLGIVASPAGQSVDWSTIHDRFNRMGAVCVHLEKLSAGGYRFCCLLPTAVATRNHRIEAVADTEADVVRLALDKSEEWAKNPGR
jgi:hypothetical protein